VRTSRNEGNSCDDVESALLNKGKHKSEKEWKYYLIREKLQRRERRRNHTQGCITGVILWAVGMEEWYEGGCILSYFSYILL
jgi:hypothetical protein